jgi:hypothetical protein
MDNGVCSAEQTTYETFEWVKEVYGQYQKFPREKISYAHCNCYISMFFKILCNLTK